MITTKIGMFHRRDNCRVCHGQRLSVVMDYGDMPLAGGFLLPENLNREELYPLDLAVCRDCSLLQVLNVVDATKLFTDYRYLSSVTHTLSQHFRDYARHLHGAVGPGGFVVEIGCNDGVLLDPLRQLGIRALGVDAADNIVDIAKNRGLDVIHGFFSVDVAGHVLEHHGAADIITASNVFAHIDDLDEVMKGVQVLLAPDGTFTIEVHYVRDLVETFQFDTVYHEHLCYYSLRSLQVLFQRFGFELSDVVRLPMHGGAVRVSARRMGAATTGHRLHHVTALLDAEHELGLDSSDRFVQFGLDAAAHRDSLCALLIERKRRGRSLSAYGAAGRATTLLNYCRIGRSQLDYVVDESPLRIGRVIPGVHVPIVGRAAMRDAPTDDCLVTAWNYRDEIVAKEHWYPERGGVFVTPLPRITVED